MKRFAVLLVALSAVPAFADSGEAVVTSALTELRSHTYFRISLAGAETRDGKTKELQSELWWQATGISGPGAYCQLECKDWVDGVLTARTVGDGVSMWAYDPIRNEYSVSTYGSYGGASPATYMSGAIHAFYSTSKGPAEYLARLISDAFGSAGAQFTPWLTSRVAGEATATLVDSSTVSYTFGDPVYRWLRFNVTADGLGGYALNSFDMHDEQMVAGKKRITWWVATLYTDDTPPKNTFVFQAPPGSRPIVGPRPPSK